ncbi:TrmH family RNA methyltransferase [Glaciecola siphonariae]|uniref:TrmH family RNA methyltransferase n=1 Tax=Glaciecola siphonariae TaxID=521012 RepID=A0ABV9LU45_9ALTE
MKLDDVKKLHQKKYRAKFGYYLVEGEHLVLELAKATHIRNDLNDISIYISEEHESWAHKLNMRNTQANIQVLSAKQMTQLSDTKSPQGIVARLPLPKPQDLHQQPAAHRNVYLHEIQDPGNLGTILRSLAWFGDFTLLLSKNCVDPFNPKVVRASMGAIFHVPIELELELEDLTTRFKRFAYLDMRGSEISSSDFAKYECYLFGNEARGVPTQALTNLNADAFTINGAGAIDSLNLASAVNICAYQLSLSN